MGRIAKSKLESRPLVESDIEKKNKLKHTDDLQEIYLAVHSNNENIYRHLVWNPNLTEKDCRYLLPRISYPLDKVFLINRKVFPPDLLYALALTEDPDYIGNYILSHPNTPREAKVILALRRESRVY